jgi:nicotinate-nucleotide adenylyltransferase
MKIAILGGSFNPVHIGHLFLADSVLSIGYDRIVLIPAFQSPFKLNAESAAPGDRVEMLCASIAGDPRLTVDDCEIKREGVSYTIDTITEIKARYRPEGKPGLILGDDLADTFHLWRNAPSIAEETELILARRLFGLGFGASLSKEFPYPHRKLDNELIDISSRQVREKIHRGENWRYLVHPGARAVIEDRGLYGLTTCQANGQTGIKNPLMTSHRGSKENKSKNVSPHETILFLENAARCTLSQSRFLHSRHTALLARDLCVRFNQDPFAGYLAGIVHDICKPMKDDELIRWALADGKGISGLEKKKPGLLHGRAAAVFLRDHYGLRDKEILNAVSSHVTGNMGMNSLAKILYIADKTEISRRYVPLHIREMCENAGLEDLFAAVLEWNVSFLHSKNLDIDQGTQRLLTAMSKKSKTNFSSHHQEKKKS